MRGKLEAEAVSDISDKELVQRIFETSPIDGVVHFAAESHVDRSILGPEAFVRTNIFGTFNLLETCRRFWLSSRRPSLQERRFLHISTDEVYGSLHPGEPAAGSRAAARRGRRRRSRRPPPPPPSAPRARARAGARRRGDPGSRGRMASSDSPAPRRREPGSR